jgi:signal peptidase I
MKRRHALVLMTAVLLALAGCGGDSWSSGDRVLVAKFLYDSRLENPARYQVVVFKYPGPDGPLKKGVPTNYIKRLMGLPGELLALFFGRIYLCDDTEPSQKVRLKLNDVGRVQNALDLWEPRFMHRNDDDALELFRAGHFKILRKPTATMLTMRRLVYDNDHQPKDLQGKLPPRWTPQSGNWVIGDGGTTFQHENAPGKEVAWLRYQHILRPSTPEIKEVDRKPQLIRDFSGYNSYETRGFHQGPQGINWVGDLMLEFELRVERPEGELRLELARGVDQFQVRCNLQSGDCALFRKGEGGEKKLATARSERLKSAGTYQIRFANFDDRLTLWIDRELPFGDGVKYEAPSQPGPTGNDLKPALIGSKGAAIRIAHLKLWRDAYYTSARANVNTPDAKLADDAGAAFWSDPDQWAPIRKIEPSTLYVQPGHYLCLGDNSPESSDSRAWGTVPERLMLGRALTVYYPFNRIGAIK